MASLIHKGDRWTLQFRLRPNQEKATIALGAMSEAGAKVFQERVEILVKALRAGPGGAPDVSTADWVNKLSDDLHAKLARAGLVVPRRQQEQEAATVPTLEKFLDSYVQSRSTAKPSTKTFFGHTKRCLIDFFGATRPLDKISAGEVDQWREWLTADQQLADNTVRRRCGVAKQFFRAAVRLRLIAENPFADMKGCVVHGNPDREYFVTRDEAAAVLEACPDAEWRLIFALSRYAGLRCPSEHLALRWGDVDWEHSRMLVRASKTERHKDKGKRLVPIFPELRPFLEEAFEQAEDGAFWVVTRYRDATQNMRTQLERIIHKAGLKAWPKLFANLRATRATELVAAGWPEYKVCKWLGHTEGIAKKHYWQITDEDYRLAAGTAAGGNAALQIALQTSDATERIAAQRKSKTPVNTGVCRGLHLTAPPIVGDTGLEPVTPSLSSWCSNQLS
jgi:integrase